MNIQNIKLFDELSKILPDFRVNTEAILFLGLAVSALELSKSVEAQNLTKEQKQVFARALENNIEGLKEIASDNSLYKSLLEEKNPSPSTEVDAKVVEEVKKALKIVKDESSTNTQKNRAVNIILDHPKIAEELKDEK